MSDPKTEEESADKGSVFVTIQNIGDNDHMPYMKADVTKTCRVGPNYAFSFYQIDYNALANAASGISPLKPENVRPVPVGKIVMDEDGFNRFRAEFTEMLRLIDDKGSK